MQTLMENYREKISRDLSFGQLDEMWTSSEDTTRWQHRVNNDRCITKETNATIKSKYIHEASSLKLGLFRGTKIMQNISQTCMAQLIMSA